MTLRERARRIRLLLMDVDGVLTDGRLFHFGGGDGKLVELKGFDSQDGIALIWLSENGVETGLISGRKSEGVVGRAKMLRMRHVVLGTFEKLPAFEDILRRTGLKASQAAFIGDDLPDVPVLRRAGLAVCVPNARAEVRRFAHLVTRRPGGHGAVREVAELILKSRGSWTGVLRRFSALLLLAGLLPLAGCVSVRVPSSEDAEAKAASAAVPPATDAAAPAADKPAAPKGVRREQAEEAALKNALQFVQQKQTSYRVGPADLLEITVYQEKDLDRKVRVSPEGGITLPLAGAVKVAGLTVAEAEAAVLAKLKRYLVDPQVSVFIQEYGNKQVYVLGEVKNPGSYPLPTEAPLTVLEAVTLAGGFTPYAAVDRTRIVRNVNGRSETLLIEITAITKRGDKSKDLRLQPNDVVIIPESLF
ncbi:MAG: polysaccharide biosynthesis/export family protein [Elusimicrobiota bacterium]|jgi:3-deoxy-D-manno-octulosonate 8-phosphate phosphatase (KDO 8-P phosphatase)